MLGSHKDRSKMTLEIRLKRPISPLLEVGSENFFDSHSYNYIGKLNMIKWNRSDTDGENE